LVSSALLETVEASCASRTCRLRAPAGVRGRVVLLYPALSCGLLWKTGSSSSAPLGRSGLLSSCKFMKTSLCQSVQFANLHPLCRRGALPCPLQIEVVLRVHADGVMRRGRQNGWADRSPQKFENRGALKFISSRDCLLSKTDAKKAFCRAGRPTERGSRNRAG
jgi:hypothetical protein